jgi:hypothetical protein
MLEEPFNSKDGTETLKAVYSEIKGKFIPVK